MTDERLAELRALAAAATPGPWARGKDVPAISDQDAVSSWGHEWDLDIVAVGICESDNPYITNPAVISSWGYDADGVEIEDNDAAFIVASRTAIPELLDAIERVKKAVVEESYPDCDNFNTMEDCIRVSTILAALNGTEVKT